MENHGLIDYVERLWCGNCGLVQIADDFTSKL